MEETLQRAAQRILKDATLLESGESILIIHGAHNEKFARFLYIESIKFGAFPMLWSFDDIILRDVQRFPEKPPKSIESLISNFDVVLWLSQYTEVDNLPEKVRKNVFAFWDGVYNLIQDLKVPTLLINLPCPQWLKQNGIEPKDYIHEFISAVDVDYAHIHELGLGIAEVLKNAGEIWIEDENGTHLKLEIEGRTPGLEDGTLRDCRLKRRECEVEIPAGEVYIAPIESSAEGRLVLPHEGLELEFKGGKIVSIRGENSEKLRMKIAGVKGADILAEFGIGLNPGVNPLGLRIFDEKALGTAHIAIGHNTHLGGANISEVHLDFVLLNPKVLVDGEPIMEDGRIIIE